MLWCGGAWWGQKTPCSTHAFFMIMSMSIKDLKEKIKRLVNMAGDWLIALLIILVATASFGLGRLSKIEAEVSPVRFTTPTSVPAVSSTIAGQGASVAGSATLSSDASEVVVGSKNGSTYHFPWCGGAMRIKEENKVSFINSVEARKAGYEPAKNCKGLQ